MEANDKRSARQPLKPVNRTLPASEAAISKPRAANKPPGSNVPSRLPRAPSAVTKPAPRTGTGSVRPPAAGKPDSTRPSSIPSRQPAAAPQVSARPPARKPPVLHGAGNTASTAAGRSASSRPPTSTGVSSSKTYGSRGPVTRASTAAKPGAASVPSAVRSAVPARSAGRSPTKAPEPRSRQLGMDKLQQEYESLQQKLAQLKRDSNRDGGSRGVLCTPRSAANRAAQEHVPSSVAPSTAQAAAPAPTPLLGSAAAAAGATSYLPGSFTSNGHATSSSAAVAALTAGAGGLPSAAASAAGAQSTETLPSSSCEGLDVQQLLSFSTAHPSSTFAQLAEVALGDPELVSSMQHVLTAQLQRTKDGATAQSRIAELAGGRVQWCWDGRHTLLALADTLHMGVVGYVHSKLSSHAASCCHHSAVSRYHPSDTPPCFTVAPCRPGGGTAPQPQRPGGPRCRLCGGGGEAGAAAAAAGDGARHDYAHGCSQCCSVMCRPGVLSVNARNPATLCWALSRQRTGMTLTCYVQHINLQHAVTVAGWWRAVIRADRQAAGSGGSTGAQGSRPDGGDLPQ